MPDGKIPVCVDAPAHPDDCFCIGSELHLGKADATRVRFRCGVACGTEWFRRAVLRLVPMSPRLFGSVATGFSAQTFASAHEFHRSQNWLRQYLEGFVPFTLPAHGAAEISRRPFRFGDTHLLSTDAARCHRVKLMSKTREAGQRLS